MKTIEEIIKTAPVTSGFFEGLTAQEIMANFAACHTNENVIYADYDCPPYEGYAYVLFEQDGKLYEVHGSHCSCYGLEDQWGQKKYVCRSW